MKRTAVVICPGRGSYNREELGYIARHHGSRPEAVELVEAFDAIRIADGDEAVSALDAASAFTTGRFSRGDIASPLIFAAAYLDSLAIDRDRFEILGVTGNSMGWYTALAVAGALSAQSGFSLANAMGKRMHAQGEGGQLLYPVVDEQWRAVPGERERVLRTMAEINRRDDATLALSIDLGGMLVIAGSEPALARLARTLPPRQERYPMRLVNHAAFHTAIMAPVSALALQRTSDAGFREPLVPLIDGRGEIWYPPGTDSHALFQYTLGHQVTHLYDFARSIRNAAHEIAPDCFILAGPGAGLGAGVAQILIAANWRGLDSKRAFQDLQQHDPVLLSMGLETQRGVVAG